MNITKSDAIISLVGGEITFRADGIISYHNGQTPPSESEIQVELSRLLAEYPLQELREKRNALLAETDWTGLSDVDMTNEKLAEWKLYRQKLRDFPDGLTTPAKVKAATWPTKP